MKIVSLNEPEQTQVIKYNFNDEPQHFTSEYFPKWWQSINVRLKGFIHFSCSVKRQLMNDTDLARLLMNGFESEQPLV